MSEGNTVLNQAAATPPVLPTQTIDAHKDVLAPDKPAPATGVEAVTSTVPAAAVPAQAQDSQLAAKFAALSKRERNIYHQNKAIKAEKLSYAKYAEAEELAKQSKIKAIEKLGFTYDELTNEILRDGKPLDPSDPKVLKTEMEQLRESHQRLSDQLETKELQTKVESYKGELGTYIDNNPAYEIIKINNAKELVFDVMTAHWEKTKSEGTPTALSEEEACKITAGYLREQLKTALKANLKFIESDPELRALLPKGAAEAELKPETTKEQTQKPTLTNQLSSTVTERHERELSYPEMKKKAAATLRFMK